MRVCDDLNELDNLIAEENGMTRDYIGTKRVTAWPEVKKGSPVDYPDGGGDLPGYAVKYEDGFTSWSPKDVFEKAYQPLDELSFEHALFAMKEGTYGTHHSAPLKVARAGWNGKGMYIFIIEAYEWKFSNGCNDNYAVLPFIAMKTADDKIVPWLASQTDILSNDWCIVE